MEPRLVGAPSSCLDTGFRTDASDFVASPQQSRDNRGYPDPIGIHTLAVETDTPPSRTIVPSVDCPEGLPASASLN